MPLSWSYNLNNKIIHFQLLNFILYSSRKIYHSHIQIFKTCRQWSTTLATLKSPEEFFFLSPTPWQLNGQRRWIDFFLKEDTQKASSHVKICSAPLVIREMHSKPQWDIISHLAEWLISKRQELASVGEDGEKRDPQTLLMTV